MSNNEKKLIVSVRSKNLADMEHLEVTELLLSDYIRRKEKNILKKVFKQSPKLT